MFAERFTTAAIVNYVNADVKLYGKAERPGDDSVECRNIYHVVIIIISLYYTPCLAVR